MIFLASCFRDSVDYLERHRDQVERLRKLSETAVFVIAVEGDSWDDTYDRLKETEHVDEVLKVEHGGEKYGSVVNPLRWRQLAVCGNAAICAAVRQFEPGDVFCYVESDLVWEPEVILALIERLKMPTVHAVAPMSMALGEARFYDIFGHVQSNGRPFHAHPPYYEGWHPAVRDLVAIDSAGSCFVCDERALKAIQFSHEDCIRGIGRTLMENGMQLWLDPTVEVLHP